MPSLFDVKQIISEINRIHAEFSVQYFDEIGKEFNQYNLSKTVKNIPYEYIYSYRLYLHESINDYLISLNVSNNLKYWYRVKTREAIDDKIDRFINKDDQYPVNNLLNDIFGARIIINKELISEIINNLDLWQEKYGLKNWYIRDKDNYKGLHIYFKNKDNRYFPWELQIWNDEDIDKNIASHKLYKRKFINN